MTTARGDEFGRLAGACLQRFLRQNGRAELPDQLLQTVCRGVWRTAVEEGLPAPLGPGERGEPGEMPPERVNRLLERALAGVSWPPESGESGIPVRQLLKACLQPEFADCRLSYKEVVDGRCRRQELGRVRERMSGTHCVDCPYWDRLAPDKHAAFLAAAWHGDRGEFLRHRGILLPEDYRQLRSFLYAARRG